MAAARIPMPRLKRVWPRRLPKSAETVSLREVFGKARASFYKGPKGELFALGSLVLPGGVESEVFVCRHNPASGKFEKFVRAEFTVFPEGIELSGLTVLPAKIRLEKVQSFGTRVLYERQNTGLKLFRLILNEAVAFAKARGLGSVFLFAQDRQLIDFYKRFGFEFEGGNIAGVFTIGRAKKSA